MNLGGLFFPEFRYGHGLYISFLSQGFEKTSMELVSFI